MKIATNVEFVTDVTLKDIWEPNLVRIKWNVFNRLHMLV